MTSVSPKPARRRSVGVIMTSPECRNGTERCAEALAQLHEPDLVINFQGDALLTPPGFVEALIARMEDDPRRAGRDARDASEERRGAGASGGGSGRSRRRHHRGDGRARPRALFLEAADPASAEGALERRDVAGAPPRRRLRLSSRGAGALCRDAGQRTRDAGRAGAAALPRRRRSRCRRRCRRRRRSRLRELNNPEDVAPIEQALAEAGLE